MPQLRLHGLFMLVLVLGVPSARAEPPPPAEPERLQVVEWSVKLLYRGRFLMRKIGVDQWSGARLLTTRTPHPHGGDRFSMVRPLEDPWVFRWYPSKTELKLGASIAVAADEIHGDPYSTLAARLAPKAERLAEAWDDDPFWEACRSLERTQPRLSDPPTYPFYVLGDPTGRLQFRVLPDGGTDGRTRIERMSEPWLPNGWARALDGDRTDGIGFWGRQRPAWEPRGYPALSRSLDWLEPIDPETGGTGIELATLASVVEILNPQIAGRLDWRERIEWVGNDSGFREVQNGTLRARFHRERQESGTERSDQFRATLTDTDGGCRLRLEVRLSYAPFEGEDASRSSSPATNARISSRTRK